LARAGFAHEAVVDIDDAACTTIEHNKALGDPHVEGWRVRKTDARYVDLSDIAKDIDLLAGGPPCQPFSNGGLARGAEDRRDMWPAAVRAVRNLQPRGFLWENVPGMASRFSDYLAYVVARLENPTLRRRCGEEQDSHRARLRDNAASTGGLRYRVWQWTANAIDHGTAQSRQRLFIVGLRSDVLAEWSPPSATHSADELFSAMWKSRRYWSEHGIDLPNVPPEVEAKLRVGNVRGNGSGDLFATRLARHRTLRDAIGNMPRPTSVAPPDLPNHIQPTRAARAYGNKHSGSLLDRPAKTLRAGAHGVSGGENFFYDDEGRPRHFTVREAARLMDLPDTYQIPGSWNNGLRLLGNAVPANLAEAMGRSMAAALN
jgi:DNA (cytosine-5)-methyltransferase 1